MRVFIGASTNGIRAAVSQLRWEIKVLARHCIGLYRVRRYSQSRHMKLNLGCGNNIKKGWVNVDIDPSADVTLDLREPLPFADNSCATIYSEHFIEHLDYPLPAISFLSECFRALEPGGELNIGVPDTEWPLLEYAGAKENGYFQQAKEKWHPKWCQTKIEHLNFHFRDHGGHKYAYDFETLKKVLKNIGYFNISRREYDEVIDCIDRKDGTLYLKAYKPVENEL